MPISSDFIELSPAPLAFYSVVNWLARYLRRVEIRLSRLWRSVCTHGLSKLQTLNLPLRHAVSWRTFLLWRSSSFRLLLGSSSIILIFKTFAASISCFSMLFNIKLLAFFDKNFLANLRVLFHSNRIEWPSAWIALFKMSRTCILRRISRHSVLDTWFIVTWVKAGLRITVLWLVKLLFALMGRQYRLLHYIVRFGLVVLLI